MTTSTHCLGGKHYKCRETDCSCQICKHGVALERPRATRRWDEKSPRTASDAGRRSARKVPLDEKKAYQDGVIGLLESIAEEMSV